MKERPILFSAPMVQALLEGRKTQTRRVVKPQPHEKAGVIFTIPRPNAKGTCAHFGNIDEAGVHSNESTVHCPYGMPGDRLWVKETHLRTAEDEIHFRADRDFPEGAAKMLGGWRPSIFMSRKFSRILLEITSVRAERLQDISEEDAIAEGCGQNHNGYFWGGPHAEGGRKQLHTARDAYCDLWRHINGAGSWNANPWVWVIEFRRIGQ